MNCYHVFVKSNATDNQSIPMMLFAEQADEQARAYISELKLDEAVGYCAKQGWELIADDLQKNAQPVCLKTEKTDTPISAQSRTRKKKWKVLIIVAAVLVVAALIVGVVLQKKNTKGYSDNFSYAITAMLAGAANAEDACALIHDVWYNCIYEERDSQTDPYTQYEKYGTTWWYDDFNDALESLFSDNDFQKKISNIETCQKTVEGLMKDLQNPPKEYEEGYGAIKELYNQFLTLTSLATSPSGSLQSYTSDFNDADSNFLRCYKAMSIYESN